MMTAEDRRDDCQRQFRVCQVPPSLTGAVIALLQVDRDGKRLHGLQNLVSPCYKSMKLSELIDLRSILQRSSEIPSSCGHRNA